MGFFNEFYKRFISDETPRLAASLAFYTLFALAPLLLLIISFASLLGIDKQIEMVQQVHALVGPEAAAAVSLIIQATHNQGQPSLLALSGGLVWALSASLVFSELRSALDRIFDQAPAAENARGLLGEVIDFIWLRILSVLMVLAFSVVALASLVVSSYIAFAFIGQSAIIVRGLNVAISAVVYFILFALAYLYVPSKRISYRRAMVGAAMTSVLFVVGKELIGIYIGKTAIGSAYGAAGSLVVLLVWIYYSSLIVFASAQISVVILPERRRARLRHAEL